MRTPLLVDDEAHQGGQPEYAGQNAERGPAPARGNQGVRHSAQAHSSKHGTRQVELPRGVDIPRLGHVTLRDDDDNGGQRQVDEEDPTPAWAGHEIAADERPDGAGDAAEARPGADRLTAILLHEGGIDDGEAARCEQRTANALERARGDQHLDVGRQRAQRRGNREPDGAEHEYSTSTVPVAERAAQENERSQRERVTGDRPLQSVELGVQVVAERRQGDVDHRRVDHGETRAQHCRGHQPPARRLIQPHALRRRLIGADSGQLHSL